MSLGNSVRILSVCDDDHIGLTREMVLQNARYEVESRHTNFHFDAPLAGSFHLAIMCHSLDAGRAARLTASLRKLNREIRIIRINQYFLMCLTGTMDDVQSTMGHRVYCDR